MKKIKDFSHGYPWWLWILVGFTIAILLCAFGRASFAWAGDLVRVDKLSDKEKQELSVVRKKVIDAQKELEEIQHKIAKSHDMSKQDWMEWRSWYEIDGDYILYYCQYFMGWSFTSR